MSDDALREQVVDELVEVYEETTRRLNPRTEIAGEEAHREALLAVYSLRRSEPQPVLTEWRFCAVCGSVEHHHRAEHAFIPDPAKTIPLAKPQPAPSQRSSEPSAEDIERVARVIPTRVLNSREVARDAILALREGKV